MAIPDRVIVIAGPSCVGKTTLIGQFQQYEHRQVANLLGLRDPDMWDYANARRVPTDFTDPGAVGLVLHYDILRPMMERRITSYADDPGLAAALQASQLTICTVWGDGELLRTRAAIKISQRSRLSASALRLPVQGWMRRRRLQTLRKWYRDDAFIRKCYASWFKFTESATGAAPHWILDVKQQAARIEPLARWSRIPRTTWENLSAAV